MTPAFRTETDVNVPDLFQDLRHLHAGKSCFESLMSLKPEDQFEVSAFHAVAEETVVADLLESGRQDVHQETPDELFIRERDHAPGPAFVSGPCGECHPVFCHFKDTAVGDGDLVGITAKVFNGVPETVEGLFDVWTPVFPVEGVPEFMPCVGIPQMEAGSRKIQLPGLIQLIEAGKVLSFELIPEHMDRDKEVFSGPPDLPVCRDPAS